MNRRHAIKLASAAAGLAALPTAFAAQRKLRVLVLGGTGFIGPHLVEALTARGHTLTLFNRGRRNKDLFPDIETRLGDRGGPLDALSSGTWDVVIDNSGYLPRHVKLSAELLRDRAEHYIYVSSISAYRDLAAPDITEDYPTGTLADPDIEVINGETYGPLKAACEHIVEHTYGKRAAILRPTYIVGPGDPTDRFTYWPVRVARGGEMLAPGKAEDPIQFIDVRDLVQFMQRCTEEHLSGRYNVCNQPRAVRIGELLDTAKHVTRSDARFVWADQEFLAANTSAESGEIPIWSPPSGDTAGFALVSPTRAIAQGLTFRELRTTVTDTLNWHQARSAEQQSTLRAGLTPARETELLRKLRPSQP